MRFLDEFRRRPASLADHLPWAALAAPGIVLNKDGSLTRGFRFRGPDLESSTDGELTSVRARLNNALRRLGTGWCLHVEARRRSAEAYPDRGAASGVARLIDAERRRLFESSEPAFETDFRAALTWLPPDDRTSQAERLLFDGLETLGRDWRPSLDTFRNTSDAFLDLASDALPELEPLGDASLLSWLREVVSTKPTPVRPETTPAFLDASLALDALTAGAFPRLGDHHLRVVSVRGLPSATRPGLLDALGSLPFDYRWSARWIALDKAEAELEISRIRKRWYAKRKGVGVLLREAITREESPLLDTDAAAKASECDGALEALGAEVCAFGYLTLTVTILEKDESSANDKARAAAAALNSQGLLARVEDLNAVEAWLGSLPGEAYADVRRPMVSTLNLADLLPVSSVWAGPSRDPVHGAPLAVARTAGATPFRLSLHVGDVGHTMVIGPTGSGKSVLLAFLALQWFRYPNSRVVFLDKGRSVRAAALAMGGRWRNLAPGGDLALQPFARVDDVAERAWAAEWVADTVQAQGIEIDPTAREAIWSALCAMAASPQEQRTLTVFVALLQDSALTAALLPFTLAGAHAGLLDGLGEPDAGSVFDAYELEALMATPSAAGPVLAVLFRLIERGLDGRPMLLILDEAWLFLDHAAFAARIREWLKTLRKKGCAVVFATQSLEDIAGSSIAAALMENCPTQIFLPNPRALEPGSARLYRDFGLNRRQLELIAHAPPKRAYYCRQPHGRRLFDLRLSGAGLALCGAASPDDQRLIDTVLADAGPARFARAFLKAKGAADVDLVLDAFEADA
jgi:type IV secretion/conjugal transfer VirB4 family ATPase